MTARIGRRLALAALLVLAAPAARAQEPEDAFSVNPLARIPFTDMANFLSRPLFSPTRRAAPPASAARPLSAAPAAPAPPPAPSTATLRLLGTIGDAGKRTALVSDGESNRTVSVREGDTMQRWRVAEIGATRVVLQQGETRAVLEIFRPGAPLPPRPATGAVRANGSPPPAPLPTLAPVPAADAPRPAGNTAPPPGTVAGTAAAEAAASSSHRLTFGGAPAARP